MKKISSFFILFAFLMGMNFYANNAVAGEIDILINKLVDKGILSHGEAQQVLTETKEEIRANIASGKEDSLPVWIQNSKLKGDFRLRYQYDDKKNDSKSGRNRARIRYRLGVESKVNDSLKVAAGLASGGSDPRSTNQTFQDTFSTKGINLDYAYLDYNAAPWAKVQAGKMPRKAVLWEPTDLLWDGDINPEGAALMLSRSLSGIDLFLNSGFFVLDESSSASNEPYMAYIQPGVSVKIGGSSKLKFALTNYLINSKGYDIDNSADSNTKTSSTLHKYNYDAISPAFELDTKEPFGGIVPYAGLFAEYVNAYDPSDNNSGWATGFKFGSEKVAKNGDWQFKYIYRKLGKDAFLDALPDSDAYGGDTGVKGHEGIFQYGLSKNVTFGLDYYNMKPIADSNSRQHVIQADIVCKF